MIHGICWFEDVLRKSPGFPYLSYSSEMMCSVAQRIAAPFLVICIWISLASSLKCMWVGSSENCYCKIATIRPILHQWVHHPSSSENVKWDSLQLGTLMSWNKLVFENQVETADEMVQQVQVLALQPKSLPRTHIMEGENWLPNIGLWPLLFMTYPHTTTHTHIHMNNKYNNIFLKNKVSLYSLDYPGTCYIDYIRPQTHRVGSSLLPKCWD